jgi:hypothetical protein
MNNLTHCLEDSVAICYNGGAYGTYLEWTLTTLTTPGDICTPFTEIGNSHKFKGNTLFFENLDQKKTTFKFSPWARIHPKTNKNHSLTDNLKKILTYTKQIIYIYPDQDSVVLNINNYFSKIWENWWVNQFTSNIDTNVIYANWPIARSVPIEQIPIWIQREFLSYYLVPAWHAQVEWYHLAQWSDDRCLVILIKDLLYDFQQTIYRIKNFCNIEFIRPVAEMHNCHNKMLSLQQNINQDELCYKIIDHTLSTTPYSWKNEHFPLPSQAWVQWQLRNLGYEIQCHGLDIFPTDSVQLKKLIYKP